MLGVHMDGSSLVDGATEMGAQRGEVSYHPSTRILQLTTHLPEFLFACVTYLRGTQWSLALLRRGKPGISFQGLQGGNTSASCCSSVLFV